MAVLQRHRRRRGFDPRALPGLAHWSRPDAGVTRDGANKVSQLADFAPSRLNPAVQATGASQPTWVASGINGRSSLQYGGGTHLIIDTLAAALSGSDTPHTIACVATITDPATGTNALVSAGRSTTGTASQLYYRSRNDSVRYHAARIDDAAVAGSQATATNSATASPHVHVIVFTGTAVTWLVDGVPLLAAAPMDVGVLTLSEVTLGALRTNAVTQPLIGHLGDVLIFTRALSLADEAVRVGRWLGSKYGITVA